MKKFLLLALFLIASTNIVKSQTTNINATATVYAPLSLTTVRDLDFGGVAVGDSKTITNDLGTAGLVEINGPTAVDVDISFTLPTNLSDGTNNLPVSFSATSAGFNTVNNTTGITDFDPSLVTTTSTDATSGDLFVFIGGTITAGASQQTGSYTGTITLSVAYN